MKNLLNSPGGRPLSWLYGLAIGVALFSGFGQMPIYKRYYLTDLPGMAWANNFFILSDLHYLAAALLLGILAWRLSGAHAGPGRKWSWGPHTYGGWTLLGLLALSGAFKAARNAGVFLPPVFLMFLDFLHLGSAMAFMFTGLISLFKGRKKTLEVNAE